MTVPSAGETYNKTLIFLHQLTWIIIEVYISKINMTLWDCMSLEDEVMYIKYNTKYLFSMKTITK